VEPVIDADRWLRSQAEAQADHQPVPGASTDPGDPVWSTPTGVRAHRIIETGRWLNRLAALVLLGTAIAAILNVDTDEGVAGELLSINGFLLCLLLTVAIELNTHRSRISIPLSRALALTAAILSVAELPFASGEAVFLFLGSTDVLVGPSSRRFLLAVALIAIALVIPADARHWGRIVPVAVISGAGLGLLEIISYWYGTGQTFWLGGEAGLPPANAVVIALLAPSVLLIRPERPPLVAIVRAGSSLRAYWTTFGALVLLIIGCAALVRGLTIAGLAWDLAATYGWATVLVGATAIFMVRSQSLSRIELVNQSMQSHLRLLADNSGDVIWLADQEGLCVWVSQSITDALGWAARDWLGRRGPTLVAPSSEQLLAATVRDATSRGVAARAELQYCTLTGDNQWMAARVHAYHDDTGAHVGTIHALRNVDREVRYRQELQASESRLRIAMNISPVGMAVLDSSRRISSANNALAAILGVPCDDLIGKRLEDFIGSADRLDIAPNIVASAIGGPPPQSVLRVETPTGSIKWCSCESATMPSAPHSNRGDEFVVQIRDVTHEVLDREELEFRAAHDRLTGLMNRASMETKLTEVMTRTPRSGALIGVLYCDIDDFKLINDNYGHKAGDIVLMVSAKRITRILRPSDVVARIGGDEIVVILDGVSTIADCVRVGETLRAALAEPLDVDGRAISTSISVGAAIGQPGELPQDLLDRADASLYRAKRARHNDAVPVPG